MICTWLDILCLCSDNLCYCFVWKVVWGEKIRKMKCDGVMRCLMSDNCCVLLLVDRVLSLLYFMRTNRIGRIAHIVDAIFVKSGSIHILWTTWHQAFYHKKQHSFLNLSFKAQKLTGTGVLHYYFVERMVSDFLIKMVYRKTSKNEECAFFTFIRLLLMIRYCSGVVVLLII